MRRPLVEVETVILDAIEAAYDAGDGSTDSKTEARMIARALARERLLADLPSPRAVLVDALAGVDASAGGTAAEHAADVALEALREHGLTPLVGAGERGDVSATYPHGDAKGLG